jgi:hypothetical protein
MGKPRCGWHAGEKDRCMKTGVEDLGDPDGLRYCAAHADLLRKAA